MKKFLSLLMVLLVAFVVAACGNTDKDTSDTAGTTAGTTTEGSTTEPVVLFPPQTPKTGDTVVQLSSWGFGTAEEMNLLRRRIYAFNELDNDIFIEIVQHEGDWETWLNTKAAANEFPDIIQVGDVPKAIVQEWIASITDVVKADTEWENIPVALRDSVTYADHVYAIPSAYHYMGYYANIDLIESTNTLVDFEGFNYTTEEFLQTIKDLKNTSDITDGSGTIGISHTNDFVNWMPASYNENLGHFVFNGEKFEFTGTALSNSINNAKQLVASGYTFNAFSEQAAEGETSERQAIFGNNWDGAVFRNNQLGFHWGGSWDLQSYVNDIGNEFKFEFVGAPGGNVVGVSDYYGITKTAEDKQAAYTAVKYLTFGEEGINKAFDIIAKAKKDENKSLNLGGLPINEKQTIIDKWFDTHQIDGLKTAYEQAAAGTVKVLMEGNKYVPGFNQARFHYDTGVPAKPSRPNADEKATLTIGDLIWDASSGAIKDYDEVMTKEIEDKINAEFDKQLAAVLAQIAKDNK